MSKNVWVSRAFVTALAILFTTSFAWAQPNGNGRGVGPRPGFGEEGPQPPVGPRNDLRGPGDLQRALQIVGRYLELEEGQVAEIELILRNAGEEARALNEQMRPLEEQLRTALEAESPDPAVVGSLVVSLQLLRREVRAIHDGAREELAAVLNDDQKAKLQEVAEAARLLPVINAFRQLGLLAPPQPPVGE